MIRVSFVWRRLLAPYCRYLAAGHQPYVEDTTNRSFAYAAADGNVWIYAAPAPDPPLWACPRCYAGWPGPAIRIERT